VRHCRTALPHGIDKAQGGRGTREWTPDITPLIYDSQHECPEFQMDDPFAGRPLTRSFPAPARPPTPAYPTRTNHSPLEGE